MPSRQLPIRILIGALVLGGLQMVATAQGRPKNLRELQARIEGARSTSQVVQGIGRLHLFRTSAARVFVLGGLGRYRDEAIRAALYKALAFHPHAHSLAQLTVGFRTTKSDQELDGIVIGLGGQGRRGQVVLEAGLQAKNSRLRRKALSGLSRVADRNGAIKAIVLAFAKADTGFKVELLNRAAAMGGKGATAGLISKLVFGVLSTSGKSSKSGTSGKSGKSSKSGKPTDVNLRLAALRALSGKTGKRVLKAYQDEFEHRRDPRLLRMAALGLVAQGNAGIAVLLRTLESEAGFRREAAIAGLGNARKSRQATRALIDHFHRAKPRQREAVLRGLANHQPSTELTGLRLEALESGTVRIRAEALYQLAVAGHRAVRDAAEELAADAAVRKDDHAAGQVFYSLGTVLGREALPAFLLLAKKRGWTLMSHWRRLLMSHRKRVLALVAGPALSLDDPAMRSIAVHLLVKTEGQTAVSGLLRALQDESPQVVVTAMRALVKRKSQRIVPTLEANLDSPAEDVRVQAMLGLHEFRRKSAAWGARLLRILRNTSGATRLVALDLLARIRLRPALSAVQRIFDDERWQARSAAFFFCLLVRDKSSIPLLIARLPKESGRLRAEVLGTLRGLTNLTYREAPQWQQWWQAEGAGFVLPPAPKKLVGRSSAAAMTYYSMPITSNRVCFIVDTSGSMGQQMRTAGIARLEVAKKALHEVIRRCSESFRFNIITFGSVGRRWKRALRPATVDNKDAARLHVKGMRASGGTNVFEALFMAFEDESIDTIYLLSDGYPTAGDIVDQQELADEVQRWNAKRLIVINTIAIGTDSPFLRRLAEDSEGSYIRRR